MLAEVGFILIGLSLGVSLYAALAAFLSLQRTDPRWEQSARNGVYAATGLLTLALLLLLGAPNFQGMIFAQGFCVYVHILQRFGTFTHDMQQDNPGLFRK